MPGKIWPWIHLPDCYSLVGAQAQSSSCSEGHAIDGMPARAAYKGPNIPINTQVIAASIRHTGTLSGNIRFVILRSFEKYCCAVVLHSRLSTRKSLRTELVNTVSMF